MSDQHILATSAATSLNSLGDSLVRWLWIIPLSTLLALVVFQIKQSPTSVSSLGQEAGSVFSTGMIHRPLSLDLPRPQLAKIQGIKIPDQQVPLKGLDARPALVRHVSVHYGLPLSEARTRIQEASTAARRVGVSPYLMLAVVGVESSFDPKAISHSGAVGLAQVLPSAHEGVVIDLQQNGKSLWEPQTNLHVGARILAHCLSASHGNLNLALQHYNGTAGSKKGQLYASKVLGLYHRFRTLAAQEPKLQFADVQTR